MYEDDPQDKVFDVLGEAVFGSHPLGRAIIGRAEVVAGTPADGLRTFYDDRYVPRNIVVAAAGSLDHDELVEQIARPRRRASAPPAAGVAAAARRARAARAVHREGHRAVPPVPRRPGDRARRRSPLRAARARQRPRRLVVVAAVPGGAREARPGLLGLLVPVAVRRDRAGRPVPRHAARQRRRGDGGRRRRARALPREPATPEELERSKENVKGRLVLALESTTARMNRLGLERAGRAAAAERRRDGRAHRRRDASPTSRSSRAELYAPERLSAAGIGADRSVFDAALEPLGSGCGQ